MTFVPPNRQKKEEEEKVQGKKIMFHLLEQDSPFKKKNNLGPLILPPKFIHVVH
jgi:hypothetical protein